MMQLTRLQHAGLEPLADAASDDAVPYPPVQEASQMTVIHGVEETLDVHLEHPAPIHRHQSLPERIQRLMR